MIPELGHFALALALLVAVAQATIPLWGAARRHGGMMALGDAAALAQFGAVAIGFGALVQAYVVSDFSVASVAENSNSAMPLIYKITGAWGNHEGSMVLWVLILSLYGALVAVFGRTLPATLKARVLAIQGMIGVGFLLFILATSNPFLRLDPAPPDGADLNPLLQDLGLALHPPFLYLGYVGFSMAFSFAIAALLEGRVDPAWARWVRPWTLGAWTALTLGIAMGSWWAYYELGWGGWWFWDPVENASLMPWLAGTALLHSAIVVEKRDALKSWTILLAIVTFGFSLLGTFLVRSGVLTSVHAFAVDPARGAFILVLLALTLGGALTVYAWRAPTLRLGGLFAPISREGALVLNNLLLSTAAATVFLGTLYPLFLDMVGGAKVSVGPPFFDATFGPLMAAAVLAMAVGPMLAWKRGDLWGALGRLWLAGVAALVAAAVALWAVSGGPLLALGGAALAFWAIGGAAVEIAERIRLFRIPLADSLARAIGLPRAAWGTALGHAGLGIAVLGMTGSLSWSTERVELMAPGDRLDIDAGYSLVFDGVADGLGPNWQSKTATVRLLHDGAEVATMTPEKRFYPVQQMPTTEAAIRTTGLADLYIVLGDQAPDGRWTIRAHHNTLVPWIWGGAIVMVAGGLVSLADRRLRVGVPQRRTAAARTA